MAFHETHLIGRVQNECMCWLTFAILLMLARGCTCCRPISLDDFMEFMEMFEDMQSQKKAHLAGAGVVDEMFDMLKDYDAKVGQNFCVAFMSFRCYCLLLYFFPHLLTLIFICLRLSILYYIIPGRTRAIAPPLDH